MTSLEIAELTGKQHKNVMQAIRNMEPAWEKVTGLKFQLCEKSYLLANGVTKKQPFYSLTKTECLYIATKFNDEARAKLVLRWQELHVSCTRFPDTTNNGDVQTSISIFMLGLDEGLSAATIVSVE